MIVSNPVYRAPGALPRTAIVTGGAGVLGFAVAQRLAADGLRVALFDAGEGVAQQASALPHGLGIACDVADPARLAEAYAATVRAFGPVGVVVHGAGAANVAPFLDMEFGAFAHALAVNLTAAFVLFQLTARDLVTAGAAGRFVTVTSVAAERAGYGRAAYGTAKAAAGQLMRQMALELGPYGITANAVAPGPVDTPFARDAQTAEMRADYVRTIPMARFGTPGEVADATAFLASEQAGYISGQTLFVDGGYMAAGMGVSLAQSTAAVRRP